MHDIIEFEGRQISRWQIGSSTFLAAPELGARLMSWKIALSGKERNIIHWPEGDNETPFDKVRGGNPILFPFCARTYHKGIENQWLDTEGLVRPMPRHGFARDGRFLIVEQNHQGFIAELVPTENTRQIYPYDYTFRVGYHFGELSLRVTLSLKNNENRPIPWAAGHHFYFSLPWHPQLERKDYRMCMQAKKAFYPAPDGKLVPDKSYNGVESLDDPKMIERIHTHLKLNTISFGPKNGEEDISITIGDTEVPSPCTAVVTWSESETAPYYCVEPWMAPPNAAEHGKGLHWINPGETEEFQVAISLM